MNITDHDIILLSYKPVSLEEIDNLTLMNRIDTKFAFSVTRLPLLLEQLMPYYSILEIDGRRTFIYKTRYFDTADMMFYNQHVTGKLARYKVRFRTYESTGTTYLEVKKRTNRNRTIKFRILRQDDSHALDENAKTFISRYVPSSSLFLEQNIHNVFSRMTLAGKTTKERITIDIGMSYESVEGETSYLPYLAIAEVKSDRYQSSSPFILAARKSGIKPTGFSKYCMGNVILREVPKKNILKQKILLLNKIRNEVTQSTTIA
ncbi:MAG TPA: polyphosphate polymerase domain-containing protein [Bacteroidales bacterium]|nr:polyphosphate polymerase domain-containing protein [Bacteroidales bacterium]HPF03562.1 polyphosphate polymerase domain-containing protein [Bacteroidales bacterium]HPJ60467.1 polyphosphate polymerase domain-containing protein [Bacteroidales bacterium]HPR11180.1 polyphosphate polymerase domain-containing protein [Bacteroidales bacterium]HRW86216.1 polyphosphate polymerase domain-containing protein [Bacteroidales bacterium]